MITLAKYNYIYNNIHLHKLTPIKEDKIDQLQKTDDPQLIEYHEIINHLFMTDKINIDDYNSMLNDENVYNIASNIKYMHTLEKFKDIFDIKLKKHIYLLIMNELYAKLYSNDLKEIIWKLNELDESTFESISDESLDCILTNKIFINLDLDEELIDNLNYLTEMFNINDFNCINADIFSDDFIDFIKENIIETNLPTTYKLYLLKIKPTIMTENLKKALNTLTNAQIEILNKNDINLENEITESEEFIHTRLLSILFNFDYKSLIKINRYVLNKPTFELISNKHIKKPNKILFKNYEELFKYLYEERTSIYNLDTDINLNTLSDLAKYKDLLSNIKLSEILEFNDIINIIKTLELINKTKPNIKLTTKSLDYLKNLLAPYKFKLSFINKNITDAQKIIYLLDNNLNKYIYDLAENEQEFKLYNNLLKEETFVDLIHKNITKKELNYIIKTHLMLDIDLNNLSNDELNIIDIYNEYTLNNKYVDKTARNNLQIITNQVLNKTFNKFLTLNLELSMTVPDNIKQAWSTLHSEKIKNYEIYETIDYVETMTIGSSVTSTCMNYKSGMYSSHLISNFDASRKILYVKKNGVKIARAIIILSKIRYNTLSFTLSKYKPDTNAIIIEKIYTSNYKDLTEIENLIFDMMSKYYDLNIYSNKVNKTHEYKDETKIELFISNTKHNKQYLDINNGSISDYKCGSFTKLNVLKIKEVE